MGEHENKRGIILRYIFITACILVFAGWILYHLITITVVDAEAWNQKAARTIASTTPIEPERGKILADNGQVLAADLFFYTARIDWQTEGMNEKTFCDSVASLSDSLSHFCADKGEVKSALQWEKELRDKFYGRDRKTEKLCERARAKGEPYAKIRDRSYRLFANLSHSEYERIRRFPFFNIKKRKKYGTNGLYVERELKRTKPFGAMASRSIGHVNEDSISHTKHGVSGLEKALDCYLYGKQGEAHTIQLTNKLDYFESISPVRGYDVVTTINIDIQDVVEEELLKMCRESDAQWGTAVVMEVKTGEIKAISNLEWSNRYQEYVEGRNNAVTGYEPGSVMKPISMMVALEDGIVHGLEETIVTGKSFAYAGGRPITDAHAFSSMPVRQVIGSSSNIGMAKIILRKYHDNPDGFRRRLDEMGFFEPMNTGIAGEETPFIQKLGRNNWDKIALSRMAFGYTTRIPPMCTLAIYNAIANDGKYIRPRLVKRFLRNNKPDSVIDVSFIREHVCSADNARKLRIMLHDVVWSSHGTARSLQNDKVEIAGKTGTCYTIENGHYSSSKRLAFCGFFPYENPKYSCVVLMSGANCGAARSSGTVLKRIALRLYSRGFLDTKANFKPDHVSHTVPTLYADCKAKNAVKSLGIGGRNCLKSPGRTSKGHVPSVLGLSAQEAIRRLETQGLIVHIKGSGSVVGQSLPAGETIRRGQVIELQLNI